MIPIFLLCHPQVTIESQPHPSYGSGKVFLLLSPNLSPCSFCTIQQTLSTSHLLGTVLGARDAGGNRQRTKLMDSSLEVREDTPSNSSAPSPVATENSTPVPLSLHFKLILPGHPV